MQTTKLAIKQFYFVSCCFLSLRPKYCISTNDRSPSACFFPLNVKTKFLTHIKQQMTCMF